MTGGDSRPRIVILDAYALNPGDLDWQAAAALGDLQVCDRSAPETVVERAAGAPIVLTNKTVLDAATIDALPALRYIGVLATGYNVVDIAAARAAGVVVTNVPAYSSASVAQLTIALLLELSCAVGAHAQSVRSGDWVRSADFSYRLSPLSELAGKTLGIVGYGQIGRAVGTVAQALGMSVIAAAGLRSAESAADGSAARSALEYPPGSAGGAASHGTHAHGSDAAPPSGADVPGPAEPPRVDVDTLFRTSDVVSLHCPLTPQTAGMVDARRLSLMKPGALLLNTARGGLLHEADVAAALNAGRLGGAGLDVLSVEPPTADNPLLQAPRCIITPHLAWATLEARLRLMAIATANVAAFLAGRPVNVIA